MHRLFKWAVRDAPSPARSGPSPPPGPLFPFPKLIHGAPTDGPPGNAISLLDRLKSKHLIIPVSMHADRPACSNDPNSFLVYWQKKKPTPDPRDMVMKAPLSDRNAMT